MKIEQVKTEIENRRNDGIESIGFIGGEPTLHPKLAEMIALARDKGFKRIALCTNGSRLADPALLDRFIEAGVTRVAFSIHSHRASIEDGITQRKGSFDEKIRAIHNLTQASNQGRLPDGFSLNSVLHRKILAHLEDFVIFFKKIGVVDIRFNFIKPEHQAVGSRKWVPSFKETSPRVLELITLNEAKYGLHLTFADFPLCRLPWQVLSNANLMQRYVGENLDLVTEVTLYRPQNIGGTKRFNWKTQRTTYLKCLLPVCEHCSLRTKCEGVWKAYLDIYGAKEFEDGPALAEACAVEI